MQNFKEWMAENRLSPIQPPLNLNKDSSYFIIRDELKRAIKQAKAFLFTNKDTEDQVEFSIFGFDIMVWATKINTMYRIHMGYKPRYQKQYTEFPPYMNVQKTDGLERFATMLYDHRGS